MATGSTVQCCCFLRKTLRNALFDDYLSCPNCRLEMRHADVMHMGLSIRFKKAIKEAFCYSFPPAYLFVRYVHKHGRIPNIFSPSSYTVKVLCKMMFDRNKLLPIISDKLAVRDFVRGRVGSPILNEIFAVYDTEAEIRFDELPDRFVLKANHGNSFNYFVKSTIDKRADIMIPLARKWLSTNYGRLKGEWAYAKIPPRLFAEKYLEDKNGELIRYKFFCFDGVPKYLKVYVTDPLGVRSRYFDLDWSSFDVAEGQPNFPVSRVPRPPNFAEMIEISRRLSAGFDSMRVDLYDLGNRVVFSELTNYHQATCSRFQPVEYDYKFGSYWKVESMSYLPANRLKHGRQTL